MVATEPFPLLPVTCRAGNRRSGWSSAPSSAEMTSRPGRIPNRRRWYRASRVARYLSGLTAGRFPESGAGISVTESGGRYSVGRPFPVRTVHVLERTDDLPEGSVGAQRVEHRGHRVPVLGRRDLSQSIERGVVPALIPSRPQGAEPGGLATARLLRDLEPGDLDRRVDRVGVHADDLLGARFDRALVSERRLLDLALEESAFDRRYDAPEGIDPIEVLLRLRLHRVGQPLYVVAAGERVDRLGHAG